MLPLLAGLILVLLMILALGWDASNWFLGGRALNNLADGAAVAAADEVDTTRYYASNGNDLTILTQQADQVIGDYLARSAVDSGVRGATVDAITVTASAAGPSVRVELAAPAQVVFLRYLGITRFQSMRASATATAIVRPPA